MFERPATTPERAEFYARIDKDSLTPLWDVLGDLVLVEPKSPCVPAMWKYARVKEFLLLFTFRRAREALRHTA